MMVVVERGGGPVDYLGISPDLLVIYLFILAKGFPISHFTFANLSFLLCNMEMNMMAA